MSTYVFPLRRGWKDDTTGRNDWLKYEQQDDFKCARMGAEN